VMVPVTSWGAIVAFSGAVASGWVFSAAESTLTFCPAGCGVGDGPWPYDIDKKRNPTKHADNIFGRIENIGSSSFFLLRVIFGEGDIVYTS
jgi:hypothetical protein